MNDVCIVSNYSIVLLLSIKVYASQTLELKWTDVGVNDCI